MWICDQPNKLVKQNCFRSKYYMQIKVPYSHLNNNKKSIHISELNKNNLQMDKNKQKKNGQLSIRRLSYFLTFSQIH